MIASEEKSVFLHIGWEKTGSTSLQTFLKANEDVLNARGCSYLCDDKKPYFYSYAHFPLVGCFFPAVPDFLPEEKHGSRDDVLGALEKDLRESPMDVILSAEHFSSRLSSVENLKDLKIALGRRRVVVIVYLRPQHELLTSSYFTAVMAGRRHGFSIGDAEESDPYFNYAMLLDAYAEVFGAGSVMVRDYRSAGDIRGDFLARIGVPAEGFAPAASLNVSASPRQIELLRAINQHLPAHGECPPSEFWRSGAIRERVRNALPQDPGSVRDLLSRDERRDIIRRFEACNRDLERRYLEPGALGGWTDPAGPPQTPALALSAADWAQALKCLAEHGQAEEQRLAQRAAALSGEIASRDGTIVGLGDEIANRDRAIAGLEGEVTARNHLISGLREEVARQGAEVMRLRRMLQAHRSHHHHLRTLYDRSMERRLRKLLTSMVGN